MKPLAWLCWLGALVLPCAAWAAPQDNTTAAAINDLKLRFERDVVYGEHARRLLPPHPHLCRSCRRQGS